MNPRVLKKLSKKALAIFTASPRRDFQMSADRAWVDEEYEPPYVSRRENEKRHELARRQARVRVNHIPSIGGEYDSYAGEGTDFETFFEHARGYVCDACVEWDREPDEEGIVWPRSAIKGRITGKLVLEQLRKRASGVPE